MKIGKKVGIVIGIVLAILLVLWYLQSQGLVKVFPTSDERAVKKIVEIDESKFSPAEGLSAENYQAKIDELYIARQEVLEDPTNPNKWMLFGNILEFLNDHTKAIEAWEKVLEYQELNFAAAQNIATNYQYFLRDFEKAEEYYLKAFTGRPDYTPAYQGLMDLYRYNLTSKKDQYEPIVLQAIKHDVTNASSYYAALVDFFADNGDFEKAREYLDDVEATNPQAAATLRQDYPEL
ncbi:MAG: hypothetical protein A2826_02835 [Candidatus Doudnabacteria bacterium RIFCSPHIGHO2_01_FULL_43_23]|uniref:Uncharacterized protein n=1 Tax=Candidatus Doudnabacteria bacterium RIFCSPHIGHO2_01_FULL_43_23 TaxID=1817822 RepID=A0A1F5NRT8_9BACT|nr:MAG: hypothetical protein A2826_02835 [Candidatus Doudnabacteria bacterium RIFCSPHIGHO2_01_FULL_43_23]